MVVAVSYSPDVRWRGYVQPGIEMPVNVAATGKAIMAFQSKEMIAEALSHCTKTRRMLRASAITSIPIVALKG